MTSSPSSRAPVWALLALGLGSFGIGTTEFAPMGLLPTIASDIGVSIPTAGQLVTAYAIGVMVGAPVMTLIFSRFGKKSALLGLMGIFILGNLVSAMASGYWTLLAGRLITSLCQGAFFGIGAVVATSVAPPDRQARAVATMFMGLSIANIGGVPAAAWVGEHIGWRMAFLGTVGIGVIATLAMAWALPKGAPGTRPDARRELAALVNPRMLVSFTSTVLFAGGFFAVYTYVAPILQTVTGASGTTVLLILALIGLGLTFGNWLGGYLADWSLEKGAAVALLSLALTTLALPVTASTGWSAPFGFLIWAISAFTCVPALQMRAMRAAEEAPSLAASINIAAFNLGNAVGASVGGAAIGAGLGYASVPLAGSLLVFLGLAALWTRRKQVAYAA